MATLHTLVLQNLFLTTTVYLQFVCGCHIFKKSLKLKRLVVVKLCSCQALWLSSLVVVKPTREVHFLIPFNVLVMSCSHNESLISNLSPPSQGIPRTMAMTHEGRKTSVTTVSETGKSSMFMSSPRVPTSYVLYVLFTFWMNHIFVEQEDQQQKRRSVMSCFSGDDISTREDTRQE